LGLIINPRGASGSGKTELVRRILAEYGWKGAALDRMEPIFVPRRRPPYACRIPHPQNENALIVLGHYNVTSGGCDTIRLQDGGIRGAVSFAQDLASRGHDVLMEGLRISSEVPLSAQCAEVHRFHILVLNTPVEQCVLNLVARRRAGSRSLFSIQRHVREEHDRVHAACQRLRSRACVEYLEFDYALARALQLLKVRGGH
jgi:hypothetical protein